MDISEYLKNAHGSSSGSERGSVDERYESRKEAFQQIRKDRLGSQAESRALRASETKERRISNRGKKFEEHRAIVPDDVFDENEENKDSNINADSKGNFQEKQKTRKEKLEEFRRQKKLAEELRKKQAKPAFKAGRVHHPLAPFGAGAHQPLEANKSRVANSTLRMNATATQRSKRSNPLLRRAPDRSGTKSGRPAKTNEVPLIAVHPPSTSSVITFASTGSVSSFAPENFTFQPKDIPVMSTPLELESRPAAERSSVVIPKYVNVGTESEVSDDVFSGEDNERKDSSVPSPIQQKDATVDQSDKIEFELPVPAIQNTSESNSTAESEDQSEIQQTRGRSTRRSRSRRVSGIQPDPSIPAEELAKTPARKVKERSLSSNRRSKINACLCCNSPSEHQDLIKSSSVPRQMTPVRTPRMSRISRKSILPVVSESSTSPEATEQEASSNYSQPQKLNEGRRKSSRLSSKQIQQEISSAEKETAPAAERQSTRRSMVAPVFKEVASTEDDDLEQDQNKQESTDQRPPAEPMDTDISVKSLRRSSRRSTMKAPSISVVDTSPVSQTEQGSTIEEGESVPILAVPTSSETPPVNAEPQQSGFKTPLPASALRKAKSARRYPVTNSPFVEERRSGKKRKYSLSETKQKSSISSLFDDIPDENSPVMEILKKKFRSSDHVDSLEVENILSQFKAQRLSDQFLQYTEENNDVFMQSEPVVVTSTESVVPSTTATTTNQGERIEVTIEKVAAHAKSVEGQEESEYDVPYFRNLLVTETTRITDLCTVWESKISASVPEDVQGQIRSVVGQGRLIMAERFKQFSGLVDNCEFGTGEKTTSCMDLQGFWDMIYFQVEDVDRKFDDLKKLENNEWKELEIVPKKVVKKKSVNKPLVKKPAVSGVRAHIMAMKKKASEAGATDGDKGASRKPSIKEMIAAKRAAMKDKTEEKRAIPSIVEPEPTPALGEDDERSFDGGFFKVSSPARPEKRLSMSEDPSTKSPRGLLLTPRATKSTGGDRLRRSVLTDTAKRKSGLVSPFVSQMAKRSLDKESASETSPTRNARRSALFSDMDEEETEGPKESNDDDLEVVNAKSPVNMVDPVVPMVSPVTKTYGRNVTHTEHEQKMDVAFDLLVSTPKERELDDTAELSGRKSTKSERQRRGSQSVKFSNDVTSESVSTSVVTTPHPRPRRSKLQPQFDENTDPNVLPASSPAKQQETDKRKDVATGPHKHSNSRVSLLPGMDYSPENIVLKEPSDDLMSFSPMPTRRSSRISSAKKN